jgi:hypothetical protein
VPRETAVRQAAQNRDGKPESDPRGPRLVTPARPAALRRLLAPEPLLKLTANLSRMRDDRKLLTPADVAAEVIGSVLLLLEDAIEEASDLDAVLDVDTAAQILALTPSMVRKLCQKGPGANGLDAQRLGGVWRISRASVEARLSTVR